MYQYQIHAEELAIKVSELLKHFVERKAKCEAGFSTVPGMGITCPCGGYWKETRQDNNQYSNLLNFQIIKYSGTYYLRRRKCPDGTEYGPYFCQFGFLINLLVILTIKFEESANGGVSATFFRKQNDYRLSQH